MGGVPPIRTPPRPPPRGLSLGGTPHPLTKPTPQPAEQYTALRTRELADMGIGLTPALGATLLGLSWQHEAAHQAREAAQAATREAQEDPSPEARREARTAQAHASKLTTEARKAEAEWWALVRAGR